MAPVGVETILDGKILGVDNGLARVEVNVRGVCAVLTEEFNPSNAFQVCIRAEEVTLQQLTVGGESARNHFTGTIRLD